MTTLRVGVVDGLTDDEIIAIRMEVTKRWHGDKPWADTLAFAREVERMALRIPRQASEIVGRMAMQQMERAERAEAERDAVAVANCPRLCAEFCNEYQTQRALERAEAERDALRRENDALRELLREANDMLARHYTNVAVEDRAKLLDAIDAALARGEKPC